MIIGIHQPNYLPYLGFFDKIQKSDIFVIYDDAQFNKEDFQHRNRIRIYHGSKWLTVPVEKKHVPINQIGIKNDVLIGKLKWNESHLRAIRDNYFKAPYYNIFEESIADIYSNEYEFLIDLNMKLIRFACDAFSIKTKIIYSSEFDLSSTSTEKILDLVNAVGGDTYLSGPAGRDYLDIKKFEQSNVNLQFQEFQHPTYNQQYSDFLPNMCFLDSLFNTGTCFNDNNTFE